MAFNNGIIPEEISGKYFDFPSLEQPKDDVGLINLIYQNPSFGGSSFERPDPVKESLRAFAEAPATSKALAEPTFFDWERSQADRYVNARQYKQLGFNPKLGYQNEYKYGETQTWGDVWANGLTGMFKLAGNTFIEGWKGWGNLANAIYSDGKWFNGEALTGTPQELMEQDKITKEIMNKYAIFETPESKESIFTKSMFGNMLQQSGFAVGTTLQFLSEELLTLGLSTEFSLAKLGLKEASWMGKIVKQAEVMKDIAKLEEPIWKSRTFAEGLVQGARKMVPLFETGYQFSKYKKAGAGALQLASIGVGGVRRFFSEANMAFTEARMEAAGTYGELYSKLYDEELFKTGEAPSATTLEKIKKSSLDAANDNFKVNAGILMVMNRLQFDNLFSKFKYGRSVLGEEGGFADEIIKVKGKIGDKEVVKGYSKGLFGTLGATKKIAKDFGAKTAAWEATKNIGKNMFKWEVPEGVQELFQESSNVALQDYYYDLYHGYKGGLEKSVLTGAKSQANIQGLKTFVMGAVTGRLLSPIDFVVKKAKLYGSTSKAERFSRKQSIEEALFQVNAFFSNPKFAFPEHIANIKVQNKAAQNMEEAIANRDAYIFHNNKDSAFAKMFSSSIKLGMIDTVVDRLKGYGESFNDQEFKEAFGMEASDTNRSSVKEFFGKIADEAVDFHNRWKNLKERYGDLVKPDIYRKGSESEKIAKLAQIALDNALEVLATNDHKAKKATLRAIQLQQKISKIPTIGGSAATAFRVLGVLQNTEEEIDILKKEIESLKANSSEDKSLKDILATKQEQLEALMEWKKEHPSLKDFSRETSKVSEKAQTAFKKYLNSKNLESKIDVLVKDDELEQIYNDLIDYIELNKDNKKYIDAYNIVANPIQFVKIHSRITAALDEVSKRFKEESENEVKEQKLLDWKSDKKEEENVPPAVSIKVKVKNKNGEEQEITLIEGNEYITESNPTKRVGKNKQIVTTYEQDIIKINKINADQNSIVVTINEEETVTYDLDEFIQLAGKLTNLTNLTADQQIYFKNRDKILRLYVNKTTGKFHKISGNYINKDYTNNSVVVSARLDLVKEDNEWVLKLKYINPITGKETVVDFDRAYFKKYGVRDANGKATLSLNVLPTVEEAQEEARKQRLLKIYDQQVEALKFLISEQDQKVVLRQKRKEEVEEEIKKIKTDIEEMQVILEIAEKNISNIKSKRSKLAIATKQEYDRILKEFPEKIKNAKELAAKLEQEKSFLEEELEAFQTAKDLYTKGLEELENRKEPFVKDQYGNIYSEEEESLNNFEKSKIREIVPSERIDDAILNIEIEQEALSNRLKFVYDAIKTMETLLSKFLKYDDLINTIFKTGVTSDKSLDKLVKNLIKLKNEELSKENPDLEKVDLISTLISGIRKDLKSLVNPEEESIINQVMSKEVMQALALLSEYKQIKSNINEILERLSQLQDKLDEYNIAREQFLQLKNLKDRLEFLKSLQAAITEGHKKVATINMITKTSKSVTGITKNAVTEFLELGDIFSDEEVVTGDDADDIFISDVDKVVLSNGGLFKTADRHYWSDSDELPTNPIAARFFRFSESFAFDNNHYFIPVSKANDRFGITIENYEDKQGNLIEVEDDIKLVVVKKTAQGFKYVDVNDKEIDVPTKDNIVYTSMINNPTIVGGNDEEVLNYFKDPKSLFVTKDMTDTEILNEVTKFRKFRKDILTKTKNNEETFLKITEKSKGKQKREPLDASTNKPQELPLKGRLIEDKPNFQNLKHPDGSSVTLSVVTNKTTGNKRIKPGRLILTKTQIAKNGFNSGTDFQVYNRKLTEKEKENLFNVILAMLPFYGRRHSLSDERKAQLNNLFAEKKITSEQLVRLTTKLTEDEATQFDLAISYITGLVHFNQLEAGDKPTKNQFYISKGSFFIREKEYKFEIDGQLNLDGIIAAKDEILADLYHNVNNRLLSEKKKNDKFITAKVEDGKIVEDKKFKNYLEYLLTDEVADHTPVVYTNIIKYSATENINKPQRKNVYLKFQSPNVVSKPSGTPSTNVADNTPTPAEGLNVKVIEDIDEQGFTEYVVSWKGISYKFKDKDAAEKKLKEWIDKEKAKSGQQAPTPTPSTTKDVDTGDNIIYKNPLDILPLEKGKKIVFSREISDKKATLNIFAEWEGTKFIVTKIERTDGEKYEKSKYDDTVAKSQSLINSFFADSPVSPYIVNYDPKTINSDINTLVLEEILELKKLFPTISSKGVEVENKKDDSVASPGGVLDFLANNPTIDDDSIDSGYRLYLEDLAKEKENIEEFKKVLEKILPQIHLEIATELIDNKAMGKFINGVIQIYENAGSGTGFHEAFEAVWASYLTTKEQEKLIEEFRNRPGKFKNIFTGQTKKHSEATRDDVKEMLAEEFISYMRSDNGIIKENSPVRNTIFRRIFNFLKNIWKYIQEAFGITSETFENKAINEVFRKIASGGFANATRLEKEQSELSSFRSTLTATNIEFTQKLMEGLTAQFFIQLYEKENNIKALFDNSKPLLFNQLYAEASQKIASKLINNIKAQKNYYEERGYDLETIEKLLNSDGRVLHQMTAVQKMNTEVKELFKKYVSQFGLEFKDVKTKLDDELKETMAPEEIERNDRLGIVDAIFIDPRETTKPEIKLLIASLPSDQYMSDGSRTSKTNELNLPILEDYAKKINILYNELHSIVPISRYNAKTKQIEEVPVIDLMFKKLDDKFKNQFDQYKPGYEWIARLKTRLAYEDIETGAKKDITTLNEDEISLLIAFESSFSNNRNIPHKLIIGKDGKIYSDNTLDSTNAKRIRETWENNIKNTVKEFYGSSQEEFENGPFVYINNEGKITFNTLSKEFIKMMSADNSLKMIDTLRKLGFDFTAEDGDVIGIIGTSELNKAFAAIKAKFEDGSIKTFDDLFGKIIVNSQVNIFVAAEQRFTADSTILSTRNAEGKQQYSITLPSAASYLTNSFKAITNLRDFIASNPQLGKINLSTGEIQLNSYIQNSNLFKLGGLFFDRDGNKIPNAQFEYRYILGAALDSENEAIGKNTDRLEFPDKVVQEVYHIIDGTYYTIINSDKSSEFGLHLGHFVRFNDFKLGSVANTPEVVSLYKEALKDELRVALFEKNNEKYKIKLYSDDVVKLGNFRDIIKLEKNETVKSLFKDYMSGKITEDSFVENDTVNTLIINYINSKVDETIKWFEDLGLISIDSKNESVKTNMFSKEQLLNISPNKTNPFPYKDGIIPLRDFKKLITFINTNRQIAVFEQHKLLFGHPALYGKELAKRSSGINSQKQVITENSQYLSWMDKFLPRFDNKKERTNTFRFLSYNEPTMVSVYLNQIAEGMFSNIKKSYEKNNTLSKEDKKNIEKIIGVEFNDDGTVQNIVGGKGTLIDPYINASEADGGAYIMPDFFRDMHFLSGKLLSGQKDLLDWENANEILDRSNPDHPMYDVPGFAKQYDEETINKAKEIIAKGKPDAILQVLKPQGFGYQITQGMMHTSYLKHSVVPLTWSRVSDKPNMLIKYLQAQKDNIDIIGFTSGQKVGVITKSITKTEKLRKIQDLYNENGEINQEQPPVQEMYTKYYGFQVEMSPYAKDDVIFGTQMRKINLSNISKTNTKLRQLAEEYNTIIDSVTHTEFKKVLKDLGLRQEDGDYVTDDLNSMINTIKEEFENRNLPDNVLDMLKIMTDATTGIQRLQYRFDASPVREKIDNILNAIIDNRILAQTMHGKASVQVPSTMFEDDKRLFTYKENGKYVEPVKGSELTEEQRKKAKIVSSELSFYTKDKPYMEVMVPNFFKDLFKEGDTIDLSDIDPRLLKAIGFRIPTQALNSIESIKIVKFLDPSWGDMIVVPTEIVAKAGSDFDIDKLNLFLANYYIDKKTGKPTYIEYSTSDDELEKRYSDYVNENVTSDIKAYTKKLETLSGEKRDIKNKYKTNKDIIFSKFNDAKENYNEQYEEARKEIFKIANNSKTNDETLLAYKNKGYQLFKKLPTGIKQLFYQLKDEGITAISENKALAQKLLEANPKSSYSSTLMQMIQYHEAILDVYAQINNWTQEELEKLDDRANISFSKWEDWKEENLQKTKDEFFKTLTEYRKEYIKEIARIAGLPTIEEFKEFPIEKQNTKKARENRLIELIESILQDPDNYRQLIVPNGATTLKTIANTIRSLKQLPSADLDSTALSEFKNMVEVRERYVTGKKLVGIIALQITSHSISQYGDVELTGQYYKNGNPVRINIKFDSNTSEGKYMLNLIEDKGHQWISELLSEAMTAAVDAAKDPFIFDLNLTLNTANTWFYLQKLGVKVEDIAYLHTQPIIETYFKEVSKNDSLINKVNDSELSKRIIKYLAMEQFLMKAFPDLERYINTSFRGAETYKSALTSKYSWKSKRVIDAVDKALRTINEVDMYKTDELKSMIKPLNKDGLYSLTKEEAIKQLLILDDYLKYEDQSSLLGNFIRAISYDTTRTKNVNENRLQEGLYRQVLNEGFITQESLERVMDKTFLGRIKDIKDDIPNMFKDFFITTHPKTKAVMDKMFNVVLENKYMSKDDKMNLLNRYQNFIINYLLHTVKFKNNAGKEVSVYSYYKSLFTGSSSIAKQLKDFQKKYPKNKALNNLFSIINTDTKDTDNIKLFNTKLTSYELNVMGESLEQLKQTADINQDEYLQSFINNLSIFLMAQSGVQQSPIAFNRIMPVSIYSERVHYIIDKFIKNDDLYLDPEVVWRQFHQNNYKNPNFVDIINPNQLTRDWDDFDDEIALIHDPYSPSVERLRNRKEFVSVVQRSPKVLRDPKLFNYYVENRMWDKINIYTLYQRVGAPDLEGYYEYVPINKLGNGMYMIEVSPDEYASSILEKNNSVFSEKLIEFFNNKIMTKQLELFKENEENEGNIKGSIKLNIIENWVLNGKADSTIRNYRYHKEFYKGDGIYTTESGNLFSVKYLGLVELKGDNIVGKGFSYTKDEFAKKEGYETWENFRQNAKYAGLNLIKKEMVHMYEIKAAKLDASIQPVTSIISSPSAETKINIYAGTKENAELSNFAIRPFIYNLGQFDSVEQAFQEAKLGYTEATSKDIEIHKQISESKSSSEIKKLGGRYPTLNSKKWDAVSSKLMKTFIKLSFEQNPDALEKLLATGNATLTHVGTEKPNKWTTEFPKLLMEVREELRGTQSSVRGVQNPQYKGLTEFNKLPGKSTTPTMTYAGIGSRQTPPEILAQMTEIAKELETVGYTLNTGKKSDTKEEGADKAFSDGAKKKNLFSPSIANERTRKIANEIHPNLQGMYDAVYNKWVRTVGDKKAKEYAQGAIDLQARNTNQVFGENLDKPVDFVLFYAKETKGIRPEGGTGQAVQMARMKGIPTINMANPNWRQELDRVLSGGTQPVSFGQLTEFTAERKQEIISNFAAKHKISKEEAVNYINEALIKDKENTINKLKECY